jgi:hypothetical protein
VVSVLLGREGLGRDQLPPGRVERPPPHAGAGDALWSAAAAARRRLRDALACPSGLGSGALTVWIGVALLVFFTAFDLYTLPQLALGAELSSDSHERTRLFAVRQMSFTVGMLLAFGGIQWR